jgi:hypothetical protein
MSIFDLHSIVLADYRDFVRSFFIVADERARQFVEHALVEEARLWPDFLLQVSPAYARAATVDELAVQSVLHETTARIFRTPEGHPGPSHMKVDTFGKRYLHTFLTLKLD